MRMGDVNRHHSASCRAHDVISDYYEMREITIELFLSLRLIESYHVCSNSFFKTLYDLVCYHSMLHVSDVHLLYLALVCRYSVDVVDTAGSPELFEHLAHGYIESSDAFVCVYSALNPASLDVARGMMTVVAIKIKYYRAWPIPLFFCNWSLFQILMYNIQIVKDYSTRAGLLERIGVDRSQLGRTRRGTAVLLICNTVEMGATPGGSVDEKAAAAIVDGGKNLAKELMCVRAAYVLLIRWGGFGERGACLGCFACPV